MSIFSDHDVGALSDDEFERECGRMNRRDRAEREKQDMQALWEDEDSEGG